MVDHNAVSAIIRQSGLPVFLVRHQTTLTTEELVFHTCSELPHKVLTQKVTKALAGAGFQMPVRVVRHRQSKLESVRSLETLVSRLGDGGIIYDPTAIGNRASKLVALAKSLRFGMARSVSTMAFEPRRRTLYLILDNKHSRSMAALATSLRKAHGILSGWEQGAKPGFDLAVRVGFELPPGARVVAIDNRSVVSGLFDRMKRNVARAAATLGLATAFGLTATSVHAADPMASGNEPAVSAPNVTVITKAGDYDGDFASDVGAKITVPLGDSFGAHFEGQGGTDGYVGVGGELFWRDPSVGLLGVYGTFEKLDGVDMTRIAAEAELYLNQVTLGAILGDQSGDVDSGMFGRVDLRFYATPDFVLRAGGELSPGIDLARVGAEWRPGFEALPGLSLFADGEFGEDYTAVMSGIRLHFGGSGTTLVDRDRREDPSSKLDNRPELKTVGYDTKPPT
jgi:hypothetical protein